MIYEITHLTRYSYGAIVELTTGVLRLAPRSGDGQEVQRFSIVTDPVSQPLTERLDPFGNRVTSLRIEKPHRQLSITASSRVRVNRTPPPTRSPAWETVAAEAIAMTSLDADCPAIALYPSRRVALFDEATAYAKQSFGPHRPIFDAASELARRIRSDFTYDPEATEVNTPAAEAFDRRRGVCQDFAHIMIAAVRGIALPALYVSGYIRTLPPPGKERLAGRRRNSCVGIGLVRRVARLERLRPHERNVDPERPHCRRQGSGLLRRLPHRKHGSVVRATSARSGSRRHSRLAASFDDSQSAWQVSIPLPLAFIYPTHSHIRMFAYINWSGRLAHRMATSLQPSVCTSIWPRSAGWVRGSRRPALA